MTDDGDFLKLGTSRERAGCESKPIRPFGVVQSGQIGTMFFLPAKQSQDIYKTIVPNIKIASLHRYCVLWIHSRLSEKKQDFKTINRMHLHPGIADISDIACEEDIYIYF